MNVEPRHLSWIQDILARRVPDREVWAFGSRVKGTSRPTSDLDLVIRGEAKLPWGVLCALRDDFSESSLPFKVDVLDWSRLTDEMRQQVENGYEVIQPLPRFN